MAAWADDIFANLPRMRGKPGPPLPGSPARPEPPPSRGLRQDMLPVDPRAVVGGMADLGARGVGHAVDYATGSPYSEDFSTPTLGREAYSMLTSPTFGGGMSPMAGAVTLAAAPLGMAARRAAAGGRTAEEIATGGRTAEEIARGVRATSEADTAAQAARAAQSTAGQNALDRMVQASQAAPSATDIATGTAQTGRALTDIAPDIRQMPVDQGIAQARTEAHLVPARGGGFVGAPPNIQTYADLQARRNQVDDYIAQHLGGANWYDRARSGISAASGGDPVASEWLSKLHGSLSAGVSPESETAFAIKEAVSRAAGEPQVAHWGAQSAAIDRAIAANDPSLMQFGDKTEEYAAKINPNQPPFRSATGVNDFRQLKLWGYPGRAEGVDPSAGATQHRFLDYETALTVDRANQANLGGRSDWTGEQAQAVPWVTQKAEDLGIPAEDAAKSGPDFYPKHQVSATYEQQPGPALAKTGHLPGSTGMTLDERTAFAANDPWTGRDARDVIYGQGRVGGTGMGVPTLPTLSGTGRYGDEADPQRIARPLTPFNISSKENPIPGAPQGTKQVPGYARNFFNTGEYIRSLFGAQEMGGWTKLWDKQAPGAQNAVFVPLARDATPEEMDNLAKAGEQFGLPHVNSTAGGLAVLNYDGAPKLSTKQRDGLLAAVGDAKPDDAGDHRMVRAESGSASPAYTTPGAYTATEAMLGPDYMGRNPGTWDFFANNPAIGQSAGALARRDETWGPQLGGQGQDFWNLRNLAAADPGPGGQTWADRLKTAVQKRAVPASVAIGGTSVALYPEAGLPAPLPAQQQGTPGTTLNSPPDWWRQQQDQRWGQYGGF